MAVAGRWRYAVACAVAWRWRFARSARYVAARWLGGGQAVVRRSANEKWANVPPIVAYRDSPMKNGANVPLVTAHPRRENNPMRAVEIWDYFGSRK